MKNKNKIDDPRERHFLITDTCLWEQNKKNGTYHPHAIEVVDTETGQTRYIKSGSVIQFIEGNITAGRSQEDYNTVRPTPPVGE